MKGRSCRSDPVGRTPWSAAGPLAGFLPRFTNADEGVGRGPGGPPHHSAAIFEGVSTWPSGGLAEPAWRSPPT
jgi:hypothetical protein